LTGYQANLFEGPTNALPPASLLETQAINLLRQVDGIRLPAAERQPLKKQAQSFLRSEVVEDFFVSAFSSEPADFDMW
jgi:hypothetical protein